MDWGCQRPPQGSSQWGPAWSGVSPHRDIQGGQGILLIPHVPVTRCPAPSPGPVRGIRGGRGCCPLPKTSQGGLGCCPGWRGHCENKDQPLHEVGAAQTGLYGEYGAKPSSSPQAPFVSSQSCSGWGNPPTDLLSLYPSTALGDAVGTQCCQSPAPNTQGSPGGHPWVPPSPRVWWILCPLWSRTWCPCSPPPWDSSSTMRCQGACGGLPAPTKAREERHSWEHPCHTQQHLSPDRGWWPLSEPPPWGQVPWG